MSQDAPLSAASRRATESDEDVALRQIREACKEFEHEFTQLFRERKTYSQFAVRLEVKSVNGRVTDVDVNRFSKRQPTRK